MLSVIICTYNREKYIYECLSRLAKNEEQAGWEIVLINNNSTDSTAVECERFEKDFPKVHYRYFVETQQGLSFARNRGVAEAKGEWLVFLDDDAMVETDYIANLKGHLMSHPAASAFGGQIAPFFEDGEPNWYSKWSMGFVSAIDRGDKVHVFPDNKFPIGANMGIKRDILDKVGVFNTELGRTGNNLLAGEEKDLFNRIRKIGGTIYYFPNIGVKHCIPGRRTTKEFVERLAYGVGVSELLRTRNIGTLAYCKRLFMECVKWAGTIVLWCLYRIQGHRPKGDILVSFRCHVTKGLLSRV